MLGMVKHSDVHNVLIRGDIFLNCSLTEAFCIAIVEAASCGLLVVSTKVGGVPEVLPPDMIKLAEPNAEDLIDKLTKSIPLAKDLSPWDLHENVKQMYSWDDVAERTEKVYARISKERRLPLMERLRRHYGTFFYLNIAVVHGAWFSIYTLIRHLIIPRFAPLRAPAL